MPHNAVPPEQHPEDSGGYRDVKAQCLKEATNHNSGSDNAGESWEEVSGNLPTDFGFAIDVHAHEPGTIDVVPIKS